MLFSTLRAVLRRTGLRQAVRVLHYGLIVLAAWAAAAVVVRLATLDFAPEVETVTPAAGAEVKVARRADSDDSIILRRNLFGATDLEADAEEAPATETADLKLRGIAASRGTSFAVFENTASGEQNVFAVGEKVFDGPRLVAVDPAGAEVLLRGRKHRYEIEDAAAHEAAPPKSGKPDKAARATGQASGVRKTGESEYLVDRREVEQAVANLNEVITQARAVPVLEGGKSAGFKLFAIRPGSIFEKIGLVNGDVVQRINDTALTDPSKAVGLLEEIQSMGQVRVNFVRSGKLHSNTYTIR